MNGLVLLAFAMFLLIVAAIILVYVFTEEDSDV